MNEVQEASEGPGRATITDRCPTCGNRSLFIGGGGYLTCGNLSTCKEPGVGHAIEKLQADLSREREVTTALRLQLAAESEEIHDLHDLLNFRTRTQRQKIGAALELYRDASRVIRRLKAQQPQMVVMAGHRPEERDL